MQSELENIINSCLDIKKIPVMNEIHDSILIFEKKFNSTWCHNSLINAICLLIFKSKFQLLGKFWGHHIQ
jgi:hypothetical protein